MFNWRVLLTSRHCFSGASFQLDQRLARALTLGRTLPFGFAHFDVCYRCRQAALFVGGGGGGGAKLCPSNARDFLSFSRCTIAAAAAAAQLSSCVFLGSPSDRREHAAARKKSRPVDVQAVVVPQRFRLSSAGDPLRIVPVESFGTSGIN